MGGFSLWHWVIVLLIVVILFGRGRISDIMGDFGKGITSFKKGMSDAEKHTDVDAPAARIEGPVSASPGPTPTATTGEATPIVAPADQTPRP